MEHERKRKFYINAFKVYEIDKSKVEPKSNVQNASLI